MKITRRDFIKLSAVMTTGAVIEYYTSDIRKIFKAAAQQDVNVIWLQGSQDSGCTISMLQGANPDLVDVIWDFKLSLNYQPSIMPAEGEEALNRLKDARDGNTPLDVLIVEGGVPEGYFCTVGEIDGDPVPFEDWVIRLGARASYIVALGSCAAFGGIPSGDPNPTNVRPVSEIITEKPVINLPGCPPHPDWVILTLANVLQGISPELDENNRPKVFYGKTVHEACSRLGYYEMGQFAESFEDPECLFRLGCKGPISHGECPSRLWNNGTNMCTLGGVPCRACVEPAFPDPPLSPFYSWEIIEPTTPGLPVDPMIVAGAATAAVAAGAGAYALQKRSKKKAGAKKK
ncbi:hydrogenase small subunit [[Eubacterium] cellulosolvens]